MLKIKCSVAFLCSLTVFSLANAAEWENSASVSLGINYSDNASQDRSDKEGSFVSTVTPQISIKGNGSRASLDLISAVEVNDRGGTTDNINPRIQANADAELLENHLFVEMDANSYQAPINPFRPSGSSSAFGNDNAATTYNYSFSPYFVNRLGDLAEMELRYTYDEQRFSGNERDALNESKENSANLHIKGSDAGARIQWGLNGYYSKVDYFNDPDFSDFDSERRSADINLGFRLTRKWELTGTFGKEWNDFVSVNPDIDDTYWSTGVIWTPNRRGSFEVGYGERYFGSTPYVTIQHQARKTDFKLSYSRSITDTRDLRARQDIFNRADVFGQLIDPFTGQLLLPIDEYLTALNGGIQENEELDLSVTVKGRRSDLNVHARQSKQIRQDLVTDESTFNYLQVAFNRRLSGKLTLNTSIGWDERKSSVTNNLDSETYRLNLGASMEVGAKSTLSVDYFYSDWDSDSGIYDYSENRISLSYRIEL